jgi:predicted transposase YdaD
MFCGCDFCEVNLEMPTKKTILANTVNRLIYAFGTEKMREQMDDYHWNEVKNRLTMAAERKEGRQEGRQEGIQNVIALLEKGLSLTEVKAQLGY